MPKKLTDENLGQIVYDATHLAGAEALIDDADQYARFLEDLGNLITDHFGGELVSYPNPDHDEEHTEWAVEIGMNDSLPDGGGVFEKYDRSVTWGEGHEHYHDKAVIMVSRVIREDATIGSNVSGTWKSSEPLTDTMAAKAVAMMVSIEADIHIYDVVIDRLKLSPAMKGTWKATIGLAPTGEEPCPEA